MTMTLGRSCQRQINGAKSGARLAADTKRAPSITRQPHLSCATSTQLWAPPPESLTLGWLAPSRAANAVLGLASHSRWQRISVQDAGSSPRQMCLVLEANAAEWDPAAAEPAMVVGSIPLQLLCDKHPSLAPA